MKNGKKMLGMVLLATSTASVYGQGTTTRAKTTRVRHKSAQQEALEQLTEKLDRLETEMADMKKQIAARESDLAAAKASSASAAAAAQASVAQVTARTTEQVAAVEKSQAETTEKLSSLRSEVDDVKSTSTGLTTTILSAQAAANTPEVIHYKNIELRPGGFLAAETVNRQRGTGADVNTQFATIPFAGQTAATFSEFNASGRQSRISLLAEGKLAHATLRGYYEADFLSAGTTSNSNQSNSYTLRQRQVWAQAEIDRKWTITAGQQWSLATEYRAGLTNTKEATPLTIDAQYNVGFSWERQYGFRVVRKINDKLWIGGAVEEAQTLNIGGRNLPVIVYQQAGNGGGLLNPTANYSYNYAPDLIAKIAYEPNYPHFQGHFELYGVGRFFRDRAFPNAASAVLPVAGAVPAAGAFTSKTAGGGAGLNGRLEFLNRRLEVGGHIFAGDGVGRYSTSGLPDATAHPNGQLELLTSGSALISLEAHPTPRLDLYGYYGGEFVKRAYYATGLTDTVTTSPTFGKPVLTGYGAPTNVVTGCHVEVAPQSSPNGGGNVPGSPATLLPCTADNRNIQEGTAGYWFRFYRGNYGTLQQGIQYSYVVRHTWLGIGDPLSGQGGSPKAINNMVFTSIRYYLPQ